MSNAAHVGIFTKQGKEGKEIETTLLQQIVAILVGGITGIAEGIGAGLQTLVSNIFLTDGALSVFGELVVTFAGISLAIGLCTLIFYWLTSLGNT